MLKSSVIAQINETLLVDSIREGIKIAEWTEQQKREIFLKARSDLVPVSQASPTGTPHPSSPIQKKKEDLHTPKKSFASPPQKQAVLPINKVATIQKEPPPLAVSSPPTSPKQKEDPPAPKKSVASPSQKQTTFPIKEVMVVKKSPPIPVVSPSVIVAQKVPSLAEHSHPELPQVSVSPLSHTPGNELQKLNDSTPIRVVKSGYQQDEGFVAPSTSRKKGLFHRKYRYLTSRVRRTIDSAPVRRSRWKYVILHNSGTRQGNARVFDIYHRRVRRMQNGLAYHFVIGNGHASGNGQIEVGHRWRRQINGGHVASDYLNNIAIGICLVGDYNRDSPTPQQLAALEELVSYLRQRVGRFKGRLAIVLGHREINPKPTDCPGRKFPLRWLRRKFS